MLRFGTLDQGRVEVLIDESNSSILVQKLCGGQWVTTLDYQARNMRVLAEHFSDALGYGWACDLLYRWKLPPTHALWTLNHKGGTNHFTDR